MDLGIVSWHSSEKDFGGMFLDNSPTLEPLHFWRFNTESRLRSRILEVTGGSAQGWIHNSKLLDASEEFPYCGSDGSDVLEAKRCFPPHRSHVSGDLVSTDNRQTNLIEEVYGFAFESAESTGNKNYKGSNNTRKKRKRTRGFDD